jgi:hypothetical protein
VDAAPRDPTDDWLRMEQKKDFAEYIDWAALGAYRGEPLSYDLKGRKLIATSFGTADVYATASRSPESRVTDRRSQVHLTLDAVF